MSQMAQQKPEKSAAVPEQTAEPSENVSQQISEKKEKIPEKAENEEMIGVWVPCMSLDLSGTDRSEEAFRNKICPIFDNIRDFGGNTVILHVRPFCDALYKSDIFPSSHVICVRQGDEMSFDPLETAVKEAHKRGLSIHAWINPLRVKNPGMDQELSDKNPYIRWKNDGNKENDLYTFESGGGIYLDPSFTEVRKLIIDGVREIVRNYDVDGIHIDDYFYPINDEKCDSGSYQLYLDSVSGEKLSHSEWRESNINMLVSGICSAVHSERSGCVFGISPQCNFENDTLMGADVRKWCAVSGYADYICPQIYVSEYHPFLPFERSAREWAELPRSEDVSLYFGIAAYKLGTDDDQGTWLKKDDNLASQIRITRDLKAGGFIIYSCEQLFDKKNIKECNAAKNMIDKTQ